MKRKPGIAAVMLIGAFVMMGVALIGIVVGFSGAIENTWMNLALETPTFEYEISGGAEKGNEMLNIYQMMRMLAIGIFGVILIFAGISKVMESSELGIVNQGTANKMISRSLLFLLIIMVFPPLWDDSTEAVTNISYWILNPVYSFDPDYPCPADWSEDQIKQKYVDSNYIRESDKPELDEHGKRKMSGLSVEPIENFYIVCQPNLKVNYIFGQMLRTTEAKSSDIEECKQDLVSKGIINSIDEKINFVNATDVTDKLRNEFTKNCDGSDDKDWIGDLGTGIQQGLEGAFTNLFLQLTKALVAIQILIMSLMIGIMTDMLASMVAAALPIFLMLSLLPKVDTVTNKMLEALPAIIILPIMSAIIIVVGASVIFEAGGGDEFGDLINTWITSLGVVFFAVFLPVIMIPLLSTVVTPATQIISSAVQSGAMVTGMAAASSVTAMQDARKSGAGMGGILKSGAFGALQGGFSGMGKVNPNIAMGEGSVNIPAGDVGKGMGESIKDAHNINPGAANLHGVGKQDAIIGDMSKQSIDGGHTPQNAKRLAASFGDESMNWDNKQSDAENTARIDKKIHENSKNLDGNPMKPDIEENIRQWRGSNEYLSTKMHDNTATPEDWEKHKQEILEKSGHAGDKDGLASNKVEKQIYKDLAANEDAHLANHDGHKRMTEKDFRDYFKNKPKD